MAPHPDIGEDAAAKINLYLHVGARRADGYYDLDSLVVFAGTGDRLSFTEADELSLALDGPFAHMLDAEQDNLVLRAGRVLAGRGANKGARIHLTKNLPVASGIGGGSADAAAALRGLDRLWNLGLGIAQLQEFGFGLGSDIPVCVSSVPSFMRGRGEQVSPAPRLPALWIVLVNPRIAVPTAEIFRRLEKRSGTAPANIDFSSLRAFIQSMAVCGNDLEAPALSLAPRIAEVLSALRNTTDMLLARMSGSGATCFALLESEAAAQRTVAQIARSRPDWWVKASAVRAA